MSSDFIRSSSSCKEVGGNADPPPFTSSEVTGNPRFIEQFSNFGDEACGEPLIAQHLLIDFTPDAVTDNEISQKKTCDFWKFINNTPEIKNLMVKPERRTHSKPDSKQIKREKEDNTVNVGRTALSVLESIDDKGLVTRAFDSKMRDSMCSLGSREYKENEPSSQQKEKRRNNRAPKVCMSTSSEAKKLCQTFEEWDKNHPKSMDPPGHAPTLQHCIVQRQVFS